LFFKKTKKKKKKKKKTKKKKKKKKKTKKKKKKKKKTLLCSSARCMLDRSIDRLIARSLRSGYGVAVAAADDPAAASSSSSSSSLLLLLLLLGAVEEAGDGDGASVTPHLPRTADSASLKEEARSVWMIRSSCCGGGGGGACGPLVALLRSVAAISLCAGREQTE
jgi:hypothetical protein